MYQKRRDQKKARSKSAEQNRRETVEGGEGGGRRIPILINVDALNKAVRESAGGREREKTIEKQRAKRGRSGAAVAAGSCVFVSLKAS